MLLTITHFHTHEGSRGSVEYRDLNPDNSEEYQLKVTGTLPDGSTEELVRSVHLGEIQSSSYWRLEKKQYLHIFIVQIQFLIAGFILLTMVQQ